MLGRSLGYGFPTLYRMNWTLPSTVVAGLVGIVGAILALKDGKLVIPTSVPWPLATDDSSEKRLLVPGLQNLENNCFLNVVLQVKV